MKWEYFNKYNKINDKYLPSHDEGDTMASQIVTVINKLVYKWYNDGDVYDNTYLMEGWCNNLSNYANWLEQNVPETKEILRRIEKCLGSEEYEQILADLADMTLNEDFLAKYDKPKKDTIYKCEGHYKFQENIEDDEDDW
jgi:hypothetical protein